ncbi:hypothetical protein ABT169_17615 [Streptomyces sp. NPDC001616]|uniref:hypothetical protein n=1 Tax=Streptomyces sp. NPDC001616 TaxID=3156648 RepID=UPI003324B743
MSPMTPARAHLLITLGIAALMALLGGLLGALIDSWDTGLVAGTVAAAFSVVGSFLTRKRSTTGYDSARNAAMEHGYSAGVAQYVLLTAATYEAAVFPQTPDGVASRERDARRASAYAIAAREDVPEPVRQAAAEALAALDAGNRTRTSKAMQELSGSVYAHATDQVRPGR